MSTRPRRATNTINDCRCARSCCTATVWYTLPDEHTANRNGIRNCIHCIAPHCITWRDTLVPASRWCGWFTSSVWLVTFSVWLGEQATPPPPPPPSLHLEFLPRSSGQ
ncbi:hypothetical protein LX32DRAFT_250813 [Colletotrichum zoysiae]|uniref:Uncharacterized protein n=1 Tax=Colletotrichum zoysiae TaxID=1216348 RepID=A0AAD9H3K9_9PEZI|nr:hypothetical protein LX32DRAFT_250813 [Colletotrichum zoysiae]